MNRRVLFLAAFALLVLPVLAIDDLGCDFRDPCVVDGDRFAESGQSFYYDSLTINPGFSVGIQRDPAFPDWDGRGGSITIYAKRVFVAGNMYAEGRAGQNRFGYENGGNGGSIRLVAKEFLTLDSRSELSVVGGDGARTGCNAGNGGNGGSLRFSTVAGASVLNRGSQFANGGTGFIINEVPGCEEGRNGTDGAAGSVTFDTFTPSVYSFSYGGPMDRLLDLGNQDRIEVSAIDEFADLISAAGITWTTSDASRVRIVSQDANGVTVEATGRGDAIIRGRAGITSVALVYSVPRIEYIEIEGFAEGLTLDSGESATLNLLAWNEFSDHVADPFRDAPNIEPAGTVWTSSNTNVVEIVSSDADSATIRAKNRGGALVTATIGSHSSTILVQVEAGRVARIAIFPTNALRSVTELNYSHSANFTIIGYDAAGNEVSKEDLARELRVTLPETNQAELRTQRINGGGGVGGCPSITKLCYSVTALEKVGDAVVKFTVGSNSTDLRFKVFMPLWAITRFVLTPRDLTVASSDNVAFTVTGYDETGDSQQFNATWRVTNYTGTGVINRTTGRFTAMDIGVVEVRVFLEGLEDATLVTIVKGSPFKVVISGPTTSIVAGTSVDYTAEVQDRYGNEIPLINGRTPEFRWSASSGRIYQNGTFIPTLAGENIITALVTSDPSVTGSKSVFVDPAAPKTFGILEVGLSFPSGVTRPLTAVMFDEFGNVATTVEATWTIVPKVGSTVGSGELNGNRFTGRKVGSVVINATRIGTTDPQQASASIQVVPGAVARISIKPTAPLIRVGDEISFTADGFDSFGNKFALTVNWSLSDDFVGTITTSNGVFVAQARGITSVKASSVNGVNSSVDVTVLEALRARSGRLSVQSTPTSGVVTAAQVVTQTPRTSIREQPTGLSGFFTLAGLSEGDTMLLLAIGLAVLVAALVVYLYVGRDQGVS